MRRKHPEFGDRRQRSRVFLWTPTIAYAVLDRNSRREELCELQKRWLEFAAVEEEWNTYWDYPIKGYWKIVKFIDVATFME